MTGAFSRGIQYSLFLFVYTNKGTDRSLDAAAKGTEHTSEIAHAARTERPRLLGFIRRRVRSEEDAEDILQEVFYQLVANYSVTEPIEKLTSWLFAVARNKIIDWYRKRKPESRADQGQAGDKEDEAFNLEEILFDPAGGPDTAYARSLIWDELEEALEELPEEQRLVFVRHELEGRSFKEIAEETGEPINTLLSRKRYAILFLRERLQELYDEFQQL